MPTVADPPDDPPPTRQGPGDGDPDLVQSIELDGIDKAQVSAECFRGGCTCSVCCSVDIPAAARVRESSPVAEFVARRALYGPRRCACEEVAG